MNDKFVLGLLQMRSTTDAEENLARVSAKIREAARRGAQIVWYARAFSRRIFLPAGRCGAIRFG